MTSNITDSPEIYGTRGEAEAAVVHAINTHHADARQYFSKPQEAWHLIWQDRLDDEIRQGFYRGNEPEDLLHQYIVLSYHSIAAAKAAVAELRLKRGVIYADIDRAMKFSWAPNDPYFAINSQSAGKYQWGMHAMRFPQAWDKTKGHGYVGVIDGGLPSSIPSDLQQNYRAHLSPAAVQTPQTFYNFHGSHVMGIISATANNSSGVSGGCPTCNSAMVGYELNTSSNLAEAITKLYQYGMQVINFSGGDQLQHPQTSPCVAYQAYGAACQAISAATDGRDVFMIAASGNFDKPPGSTSVALQPDFPAIHSNVLAVGGAENTSPSNPDSTNWIPWYYGYYGPLDKTVGSNYTGLKGIMAPARAVVSTVPAGSSYIPDPPFRCSDMLSVDESGVNGDGYGSCTGTSMAAPHISALGGILRSINPRLSHTSIQNIIRASGTNAGSPNSEIGSGLARADIAVNSAIAQTPNRLTPLFSQFSWGRRDFFFTTVPQMASAATWGTLRPANGTGIYKHYVSAGGFTINGYSAFPGAYSEPQNDYTPKAAAWVFTTPLNPKSTSTALVPLYRLIWKCGDSYPAPTICSTVPDHIDTTYTADSAGVAAFKSVGYKLDGIEGYIYPKTLTQPAGTVKLMRKYNPDRDDHAIFPETVFSYFTSLGYTENSGSDWLGYVYPNSTGNVPVIQ